MVEEHMDSDLWEFDVNVVRTGSFTVLAHDLSEAQVMVSEMSEAEIDSKARWDEAEVESID